MQVEKIYIFLIVTIISVLPLVGRTDCFGDFVSIVIFVSLSAVILCVKEFRRNTSLRLNLTDIAILLFCVYVFIRDIQSSALTTERCFIYTLLVSLYLVVKINERNSPKAIVIGILLCGIVQSTIAYLQLVGFLNSNHSAFACTGSPENPALLGCVTAVSLVVAVSELRQKTKAVRWLLIACVAYMLPVLILSDSRASWVTFGFSVILILLRIWGLKTFWKMLAIGAVAMLVAIPLYNHKPVSADARVLIWKVCGNISKENPLTGSGTNAVRREYMHYQADYFQKGGTEKERLITANNNYAFNELLDILCSYGVIGGVLFLSVLVAYFACNGIGGTYSVSAMCILVFGMFSYPFSNILILVIFTLLLAIGTGKTILYLRHKCSKYIFVLMMVALLSVAGVKWREFKRFDSALKEYCWEISEKEYVKSNFHDIKNEPMLVSKYGRLLYETGNYTEAIPVLDRMSELQSSPQVYYDLGKCYEKVAEYDKAERCYKRISYMLPAYITPQYKLMKLYESTKQKEKAMEKAKYILGMPLKKETSESKRMKNNACELLKHMRHE